MYNEQHNLLIIGATTGSSHEYVAKEKWVEVCFTCPEFSMGPIPVSYNYICPSLVVSYSAFTHDLYTPGITWDRLVGMITL